MSFFFFNTKPSLSFVFDIRDGLISLAAVRFDKEKKPEIIFCQTFEIHTQDARNHKKYLTSMMNTLDKAVIAVRRGLIKMGNTEKINKHYFFIGSPWSVSKAKTIKILKDKPFEINNSLLRRIILDEESVVGRYLEEETEEPNWKVLEERIIESRINGYKIDTIFEKKATNLSMELFASFFPNEIKEKLTSFISEKVARNPKIESNSCILSSYTFFRDLYATKNNFIYVDVGRFITDVYVVADDIIFGVASFPFGEDDIVKTSVVKSGLTKEVFMSQLSIGQSKKFDLESHNNGEDLLVPGFEIWKLKLRDAVSKICTEINIPNNLFIITNTVVSAFLVKSLLNTEKYKKFELLDSQMDIFAITENVFNSFILNGKLFPNQPHIKMNLVFLDKMLKK